MSERHGGGETFSVSPYGERAEARKGASALALERRATKRGGEVVSRQPHKLEILGAIPSPATRIRKLKIK
jgi:hypothetical protein